MEVISSKYNESGIKYYSLIVCACFAATCTFMLIASGDVEPVCADGPRVLSDYMKMPENVGVPLGNAALPLQALSEQCVDRWARMLDASEAQTQFMQLQYARFVERHNEFMDREVAAYIAESSALNANMVSGTRSPEFVDAIKSLRSRSVRLCLALEAIEHQFVEAIVPILTARQSRVVDTLRLEGTRRASRTFRNNVRWADIELRRKWESVDADVSIAHEAGVHDILAEYEVELTPLVRAQSQAFWDRPVQVIPLLIRLDHGLLSDSGFRAAYRRAHGRNLNAGRAIRTLTQLTLQRLVEMLPDEVGNALVVVIKEHVYPEVYPDRASLHGLFDAVLDHDGLNGELAAEIQLSFTDYTEQYQRLCETLEALCLEWGDGSAGGDSDYHDAYLPDALAPLLEQRRTLANDTLHDLRERVGEEILEDLSSFLPNLAPTERPRRWDLP